MYVQTEPDGTGSSKIFHYCAPQISARLLFWRCHRKALLPAEQLDNNIASDTLSLPASDLLGSEAPTLVYRARLRGEPIAAIFNSIAPDGYSGKIHLLVGVYRDGSLAGVRVIKHAETPGLGDAVEERKSEWIRGFDAKSLGNPDLARWGVKRDGGYFDQFSGATITPRAVVAAVKNTLLYYQQHVDTIFQPAFQSGP